MLLSKEIGVGSTALGSAQQERGRSDLCLPLLGENGPSVEDGGGELESQSVASTSISRRSGDGS